MELSALTHSLEENEAIIERGLSTFVDVGLALAEIRDEQQYLLVGFPDFEAYCRARFDLGQRQSNAQIASARVVKAILAQDPARVLPEWGTAPQSIDAAQPLVKVLALAGADRVAQIWGQIVANHQGGQPITRREVDEAVRRAFPDLFATSTESPQDRIFKVVDGYRRQGKALTSFIARYRGVTLAEEAVEDIEATAASLEAQAVALRALAHGERLPSKQDLAESFGVA